MQSEFREPYRHNLLSAIGRRILSAIGALGLMICLGCAEPSKPAGAPDLTSNQPAGGAESSPVTGAAGVDSVAANASATSPTSAIEVSLVDHESLLERLAGFKGRVVVVDAWSTSCLPCMKEFPHLVELAKRWPEDVVCVSVNVDYIGLPGKAPESYVPDVVKFLQSKAAAAPNLVHLLSKETDEVMAGKMEFDAIPAIMVYDRSGAQAGKLTVDSGGSDGLTYAGDVVPLVEKLIEK